MRPSKLHQFEEWIVANVICQWQKEGIGSYKIAESSGIPVSSVKEYCQTYKKRQQSKQKQANDKFLYTQWGTGTCTLKKTDLPTTNMKQSKTS